MSYVPVTEYVLPCGETRERFVEVDTEVAELFKQFDMAASVERLRTGVVVVYVKRPEWDDEDELLKILNPDVDATATWWECLRCGHIIEE